jgi:response regulator RpfG family c-di-GMP phosphodiesterase
MSDTLLFAEDNEEEVKQLKGTWKVLIVDDEPEVHSVTKLALSDFTFQEKGISFLSAYSGEEAKKLFHQHNDIAIVLLDVVMETDEAGLEVAQYIRDELNNYYTRIILRTGQPGQAPERDVIVNYDINDYKSKTELTAQKLFTVVIASLRSYRDITVIDENRRGLEKIISASADLFTIRSLESFIEGIIQQLSSLMGGTEDAAYITSAVAAPHPIELNEPEEFYVFSGKGEYKDQEGELLQDVVKGEQLEACQKALAERTLVYGDAYVAAYCQGKHAYGSLLYLSGLPRKLNSLDKELLQIFSQHVQIAFDNVLITKDVEDTQREIIERLGMAMEKQYSVGKHIQRMVGMSRIIAREYGLPQADIDMLTLAVPLHDVGKMKVPKDIIRKPGPLTEHEREIAMTHANVGYQLLKGSRRPVIHTAAMIARDHHEHWDGNGYPRGLKGGQIHILSRITAVADVYDALRNKLYHKDAWPLEMVLEVFKQQSGKQFDPKLVEVLLENIYQIEVIQKRYPDPVTTD